MSTNSSPQRSAFLKPFLIGFLILTLQIPMSYITGLIRERDLSKRQASEQVAKMAGGQQVLTTPVLVIGYSSQSQDPNVRVRNQVVLLPHALSVNGRLATSTRSRGIFEIPVYSGPVVIQGHFTLADLPEDSTGEGTELDKRGSLALGIRDLRGIRNTPQIAWNDASFEFSPGVPPSAPLEHGIHTSVSLDAQNREYKFSMTIELSGSQGFLVRPLAKSAHFTLSSNWADPSFAGSLMPSERSVNDSGFTASWYVSDLSLGIPAAWSKPPTNLSDNLNKAVAGVDLLSPIDSHRMSERTTKYELLFYFLIFLAFFVYEVMAEVRLHPIQYLLVGGALTLFYLLVLSLSEHIGFAPAYIVASLLSTGLVSGYARAILRRAGRTWIIPPLMIGMYGFLYTLLIEEDYSLLSGSLGLAAILAVLMYITRNIDWFELGQPASSRALDGCSTPAAQPVE